MRPQVGQVINNKYRLLRLIGDGGMGSVYEARHEVLGTSVALKFLHAELGKRPGLVQRFLQEARVSAQIQSKHVVRVTDVDQTATGAFIVMEYIEGRTLQALYEDLYKAGRQLSYADALEYGIQMLEGVGAAHESGIVHRDLKPDNVMITLDGKGRTVIKLLDFGIAKLRVSAVSGEIDRALTRPGVIMGTPEYMAPEQAFSADAVDARADIFSLGVIVFEMLAGRRPVGGDDPHQIAAAYLSGQIARLTDLAPDVPPELAEVVHHAMAPVAQDRWASVAQLRDAMEPFAVAIKAPSVMPAVSLSRVSMVSLTSGTSGSTSGGTSGVMPAPGKHADGTALATAPLAGQRAVPKTLPPDDGDTAPSPPPAHRDQTSPGEVPRMSDAPSRGPTPLGGFAAFSDMAAVAIVEAASHPAALAAAEPVVGPAFIPPTRSVAPLGSQRDPAATALASPIGFGATPRPSGTAISDGPVGSASFASNVAVLHGGLNGGLNGGLSGGHSGGPEVGPLPLVAPHRPSIVAPASATPRRRGMLSSLPAILLLASGVSVAVVGGVYLAQHRAKADDHEDPPIAATAPRASAPADPPPGDDPDPTPAPSAGPTAPTAPTSWRGPSRPPPRGSAAPTSPSAPTAPTAPSSGPPRVPIIPSILPPVIIPSTFPWDFPGLPPSRPQADPQRGAPSRDRPARDQPSPRGERPPQRPSASRPRPAPDPGDPMDGPP